MTDEEFHRLANELTFSAEPAIAQMRLICALQAAVKAGGEPAAEALRKHCAAVHEVLGTKDLNRE